MSTFNRKFIAAAAASTLMAVLGVARAQIASEDSAATPAQVAELKRNGSPHILYFLDQGISASTDPAAHLLLIKTVQPQPVAAARGAPAPDSMVAMAMQAPCDSQRASAATPTACPMPEPLILPLDHGPRADTTMNQQRKERYDARVRACEEVASK